MRVSLITVVFNCEGFHRSVYPIGTCAGLSKIRIHCYRWQSSDHTPSIISRYQDRLSCIISEPDKGMYDAFNKGIRSATGDLVGIVNADDYLAGPKVISDMVRLLTCHKADAVYGNLNYVKRHHPEIINRKWRSNSLSRRDLTPSWIPAHPTLIIRRTYFQLYGGYSLQLGSAADYDLVLRFFFKHQLNTVFLDQLIVQMRTGGISNRNFRSVLSAIKNDYRAMVQNQLPFPALALVMKKLRKPKQFI